MLDTFGRMAHVDLSAEIRSFNSKPGPRCATCRALAKMAPKVREALEAALADLDIEGKAISRWLHEKQHIDIGPPSINRHRRGDCRGD